jgi:clan AA aspartic protease
MGRMGTFRVPIWIAALGADRFERLEALVDTGATYTSAPRDVLERLGVQPKDRRPFELADGQEVWCETGWMQLRIGERSEQTIVAFGPLHSEPILGAFTLEGFLLAADPVRQRLVPVPGLLKPLAAP